jgi:hypothetical protein
MNRYRSPPRTRRSSASSVSSGGGPPVSTTRNRSRSPSARLQAPRSNYGGSSTGLDSLSVNGGRRSITPTRSRSPTPRLSVTKTPSNFDGSNTSGRTSRNRSRSPTPSPPSRNKNTCSSPADNNNNEGADTTNTTAPPDQQSLNDSGSEVSDEGYRSLGIVASSAVDGTAIKTGQEELSKPEEVVVDPEDANHSGMHFCLCVCPLCNEQYLSQTSPNIYDLVRTNQFQSPRSAQEELLPG